MDKEPQTTKFTIEGKTMNLPNSVDPKDVVGIYRIYDHGSVCLKLKNRNALCFYDPSFDKSLEK